MLRVFYDIISCSLERIQGYIEHEAKATEAGKPPAAWVISVWKIFQLAIHRYDFFANNLHASGRKE